MAGIKTTQQQFVTNWQQGTQRAASSGKYAAGVQAGADWAANTVAALPQMFAGLQAAMSDGRIERGINDLGTAQYKNITVAKAGNWVTGVTSATGVQHMTTGAQTLYNMLNTALTSIQTLPRGTVDQNINRAVAFMQSMHNQKVANQ